MIVEGLKIMVVGMITVFCFLTLLVLIMKLAAQVFTCWAPFLSDEADQANEDEQLAVALAAIKAHTHN